MKITTVSEQSKRTFQNIKGRGIPLFWKFAIAIISAVIIFGSITIIMIDYAVYDVLEEELTKHGKNTSITIAERCVNPILYDDPASLNKIVSDQIRIDANISYIFILDKNNQLQAHTFNDVFPHDLIKANNVLKNKTVSYVRIKDETKTKTILDMAVPILGGKLGTVRIGFHEDKYTMIMNRTQHFFVLMIIIFVILGVIGAFFFSYIITTPIKSISTMAERIELGTLDAYEDDFESDIGRSDIVKWKNILNIQDEIDILISKFGEMVSRLKLTYKELKDTQTSLIQSEKMASLGTLSAGIAHEINNPITGIQNCIRRISESPNNIKQNILYLEMMAESVNKIKNVVGGLLNFSRKSDTIKSDVNLYTIKEEVIRMTKFNFEQAQIAIRNTQGNIPLISAEANHLEQVVLNLVLNSIEAIEERKMIDSSLNGEIHFHTFLKDGDVSLKISDNGIGVPEDKLSSIFDPFFTLKTIRQGIGIGLAVCYNIIKQNNGTIVALNNSKGGLSVTITFPQKEEK